MALTNWNYVWKIPDGNDLLQGFWDRSDRIKKLHFAVAFDAIDDTGDKEIM